MIQLKENYINDYGFVLADEEIMHAFYRYEAKSTNIDLWKDLRVVFSVSGTAPKENEPDIKHPKQEHQKEETKKEAVGGEVIFD